ncbi:DUF721 domain-containing protein [bacterium]|nr:DUF721 domain-containing protein [bacterium]MDE6224316.1 DUF721 domain-containing protein [Alphaproteobacteria bacterium]
MKEKDVLKKLNEGIDEMSEDYLEKPIAPISERFPYGPNSLANTLANVVKKFSPKYGFVNADIITNWKIIAGDDVANKATPVKISFPFGKKTDGTLYIKIKNMSFASIIQYQFPTIIDRVNQYFGYNAIKYIKIKC